MLAVLRYYEPQRYAATPETALYSPLHTTADFGTDPQPMAEYVGHEPDLRAEVRWSQGDVHVEVEDLERAADRGEPTIVAIQAWQTVPEVKDLKPWATDWDDGHYVVVVGYDAGHLYFMDPSTEGHYTYIERGEFADRWHDVVGKENVHTSHIAIFVHASVEARAPVLPKAPDTVFAIH